MKMTQGSGVLTRRTLFAGAGALVVGGAVSSTLASCSSGSSSTSGSALELVTVNFQPIIDQISATISQDYTARTGNSVRIINTGQAGFESVDQRVQSDLAAGHVSDLALVGWNTLRNYVQAERAVALDGLMSNAQFDQSQYYPNTLKLGEFDGKQFALPYAVGTYTMFYNADAFRKAGLDPDNPPKSFSELRECAQALVSSGSTKYGATFGNNHSGNFAFQNFFFSAGGSMLSEDGRTPLFNKAPGVGVVEFWAKLFGDGLGETMNRTQMADAFTRGELGIMFNGSSGAIGVQKNAKFEVRSAVMAIPDGGVRRCATGGLALVLLGRDEAKQRAAFDVAAELISPAANAALVESTGYSPVSKVAATDPKYLANFLEQNKKLVAAGTEQLDHLVPWFAWPGQNAAEVDKMLEESVNLALRGSKSAASALDDAAEKIKALLPS